MHFASFLADGVTWLKKSPGNPLHSFQDDIESSFLPDSTTKVHISN